MSSASAFYKDLLKIQNKANADEMAFNKEEANVSRDWQKMMSDTSHQREVADLKAAGLNPVLSSNSGAQSYTTSAASASVEAPVNAMASAYGSVQSAAATRYAAKQSAAATRYAAAMNYAAATYAANKSYETAMEKPASNVVSLIDKHFKNIGLTDTVTNSIKKSVNSFFNHSDQNLKNPDGALIWRNLTTEGKFTIKNQLKAMGVQNVDNVIIRTDYMSYLRTGNSKYLWFVKSPDFMAFHKPSNTSISARKNIRSIKNNK